MKSHFLFRLGCLAVCPILLPLCVGCSQKQATEQLQEVEKSAEAAAETISEDVGEAVEEGEKMASELGDKAMAYLTPLKEKFGDLDSLKESPEKLKASVSELIESIESKAEDIKLPESLTKALATVKEKLIALRDDLEKDIEQAKIEEHLRGIIDSIKSELGM